MFSLTMIFQSRSFFWVAMPLGSKSGLLVSFQFPIQIHRNSVTEFVSFGVTIGNDIVGAEPVTSFCWLPIVCLLWWRQQHVFDIWCHSRDSICRSFSLMNFLIWLKPIQVKPVDFATLFLARSLHDLFEDSFAHSQLITYERLTCSKSMYILAFLNVVGETL